LAELGKPNTTQLESWHTPVLGSQLEQVDVGVTKYSVLVQELALVAKVPCLVGLLVAVAVAGCFPSGDVTTKGASVPFFHDEDDEDGPAGEGARAPPPPGGGVVVLPQLPRPLMLRHNGGDQVLPQLAVEVGRPGH